MAWQGFEVFRRRQKTILAILAVLAMVLFIIGDVIIGVRMGHYGLGYGLRGLFYDTRLERLLDLHDRRAAAVRALFVAYDQAYRLWLQNRFQVQDASAIKDENLRKEHDSKLNEIRFGTWCGRLHTDWQMQFLFGISGEGFDLSAEGLLQFAYWKEEADRLGIVVASSVMRQDFERFTFGLVKEEDLQRILHRDLRYSASTEEVMQWWADEIRAILACRVAAGTHPLRTTPPTLLDLWEAYRELGTVLPSVVFVTFDVTEDRFTQAVPAPTDEELRSYFEQHKQREPDPMQAEPGFRVPTRYRIEFVYADVRYDPKDPAKTGEAWPHYRQFVEAVHLLPSVLSLSGAISTMTPFFPATAVHGKELALASYDRYLADRATRFRLNEPLASYGLTNTPLGQRIHHHGILPAGSGPWYRPGAAETEQATQAVLSGMTALVQAVAVPNPVGILNRPVIVQAPYTQGLAVECAAHVAQSVGLTLALAAPVVAGPEPESPWSRPQLQALAAASFVGQAACPGIPVWTVSALQEALKPPQPVRPVRLLPGYEGLAMALWTPPTFVPFQDVAGELELERIRAEVGRWLDLDLERLQKDLTEYRQVYEKAYREWRKARRKPTNERFPPPPFGPNKEPLEAYLQRFCQARGLRYFPMPQPRSRFELMPRASGELGKILYPLYVEVARPEPGFQPAEVYRRELDFADTLITGRRLLQSVNEKEKSPPDDYSIYQPRHLAAPGVSRHRALVWKAEEVPGYVPHFEEVREQVRQAWIREKARSLAKEHAQRLSERIRKLQQERQAPIADLLRELRGDPDFPELDKQQTVELRRYQLITAPFTGLEKQGPRPTFHPVRYPPIVDYPEDNFLEQAMQHLQKPGDTWLATNLPGDKVYLLILQSEPRRPTPIEFAQDYLRQPEARRVSVSQGRTQSLEEWVSYRRYSQYREQLLQFLRQHYGLDEEKWRQLQDHTRRRLSS